MKKDTSWHRFFKPKKSPQTHWIAMEGEGHKIDYWPKNIKPWQRIERVVWPSYHYGTYESAKHGKLKS